jgi:predicted nuclease with TOPRIM domain
MRAPRTDTETLATALDILARDIPSADGIANSTIEEAAQRLRELALECNQMSESNQILLADVRYYRTRWQRLKEAAQ